LTWIACRRACVTFPVLQCGYFCC